jgi:CBS domain containing-hemolysin-like protein
VPGRAGTVADPPLAAVVTTGLNEGVVTETVVTGVAALTVAVGTVGAALGTVVDTVGVDTVGVDTVGVDTVGTVVGTVVVTVGTVTVAPSGRAVASTFATKKPDTVKQTSTTIIRHFTTFISPSAKLLVRSKNCLHLRPIR